MRHQFLGGRAPIGRRRGFVPRGLRGCVLWLRADLGVTVDGSNNVGTWADQSGKGNHATQSTTANKPLFVASGGGGRPTIRGNADQKRGLAIAALSLSGAATLSIVFSKSSAAAYFLRASGGGIIDEFSSGLVEWYNPADRQTIKSAPSAGLHIATVVQTDGVSCKGYFDGALAFSVTPSVALGGVFEVGNSGGLALGTTGDLSEVVALNRAAGDGEVQHLHRYFGGLYGITVS